jgi:hypothetical protein
MACRHPRPRPRFDVQSSEVLVPTLVQMPSGEIVYGLGPSDFELPDNGVQQQLHVDDEPADRRSHEQSSEVEGE